MNGTAGLGQGTQVFDFTGIGRQGLMLDDRKEAKEQAFFDRNKTLYDPIKADGIRAVDAPYINQQLENAMELSAKATQTKDPADIQAAKAARSRVASLTQTSVTAREEAYKVDNEIRKSPQWERDPDRFNQHLEEFERQTAMTEANGGNVAMEDVLYKAPTFYDLDKNLTDFVNADAQKILQGSYESSASSVQNEDGTGKSSSIAKVNEEKRNELISQNYEAQINSNNDFRNAVDAQFMAEFFNTTDVSTDQVSQFNALVEMGKELPNQYGSIEEMEADPRFQRDPRALRLAKRAWNIEEERDKRGFEMYRDAVLAKAVKGKQESFKRDESKSGGSGTDKAINYAKSNGTSAASALGGNAKITSNAMKDFTGQSIGYSSVEDMKLRKRGSGTEQVLVGGVMAQMGSDGKVIGYYAVEYKPSPDILAKIERSEDVSGYLDKMDTRIVPLDNARAGLFEGEIETLKANALAEAKSLMDFDDKDSENNKPQKPTI